MPIFSRNPLATLCLLTAGALAPTDSASAQRTVWPPGYAQSAGGTAQDLPFSLPDQTDGARSIVLLTGASLGSLAGTTLRGMAFRRDTLHADDYTGFSANTDVRIGPVESAARPPAPLREPFSAPPTRVAWGNLDVARAPAGAGLPPFSLSISFRVPYAYAGGDLAIDTLVEPNSQTTLPTLWRRDAVWLRRGTEALARARGTATPGLASPPRYRLLSWVDSEQLHPGGRLVSRAEQAPNLRGLPALHYIGLPIDLPLDLAGFPAGSNLYSSGLDFSFASVADMSRTRGSVTYQSALPNDTGLVGARLTSQWFVLDPTLPDPLPILTSAAIDWRIGQAPRGTPRYGRTIWGRGPGSFGADYAARIGPVDYVPIIEFR